VATILVIDDDDAFREGLAETLEDLGHRVVQADSATAALDRLHGVEPAHCIFLDFRLPDMDGLAMLEKLRNDSRFKAVPVVMLTA
jgi:CheY-like chemotaxis protein